MRELKKTIDERLERLQITDVFEAELLQKLAGRRRRATRALALMAAACLCAVLAVSALAAGAVQSSRSDFYLRYLSPEEMAVADAAAEQYGPEVYFEGLQSEDMYSQYFSINKLVEYFGDEDIRHRAVSAITPFLESEEPKLRDAAAFALSILKKTYDHPNLYHMADGSVIFTLFQDYSDYGSYNELWRVQNDELSRIMTFSKPSMYITSITPSPDREKVAVATGSNKSSYLVVFDLENGWLSPELVDSARGIIACDKGYDLWQRMDHENYCGLDGPVQWADDHTVVFAASFSYDNTEIVESAEVRYDMTEKKISYQQ